MPTLALYSDPIDSARDTTLSTQGVMGQYSELADGNCGLRFVDQHYSPRHCPLSGSWVVLLAVVHADDLDGVRDRAVFLVHDQLIRPCKLPLASVSHERVAEPAPDSARTSTVTPGKAASSAP